ncbi:MAG: class I SAM-dependent methyltransferase [Alcanivorax sp.]|nr:class I SAM-dependent methyltransferase [Alcanivorax sp.]
MTQDAAHAGQAVYTPLTLAAYDQIVLGFSCRWLWRCPSSQLLAHYQQHISNNHLDVGVGSGYFLDQVRLRATMPRLALMDMNPDSLAYCARRVARYRPQTLQRNVLAPIAFEGEKFDSLGLNFLLHCLPGDMSGKARALDNLRPLLHRGATVFGSTLLQGQVPRSLPARGLMRLYNAKGIFSNRDDTLEALREALEARLERVEIRVQGCAALFSGRFG